MKPIIITIIIFFCIYPISTHAETVSTSTIISLVKNYSLLYDIDPALSLYIVENESGFNPLVVGDMHITCPRTGKPVRARGLFQITDCYHEDISDTQAFDPYWSIGWAMQYLSVKEKCMYMWTVCRDYFNEDFHM